MLEKRINSSCAKGTLLELTDPGVVVTVSPGGATVSVSIETLSIHTAPSRSSGEGGNIGMFSGLYR